MIGLQIGTIQEQIPFWKWERAVLMFGIRFGKSTHITMISNSVTQQRSYTNSAIAGNSTWYRRRRRDECRRLIEWPPRDRQRRCHKCRCLQIERRRLRIERRYHCIEWQVFHDVSQCFKSVSCCFTSGSWSFTMYHNVLHVFHDVLCLASHATIGIADRAATDRLRDRDNAAGIGDDNSAEISDGAAGIINIAANVIPC